MSGRFVCPGKALFCSNVAKAILLAEDSSDDEHLFKLILTRNGIENPVMVVRDGAQAVAYLQGTGDFIDRDKHPLPVVLFLDLKMPGMDGFAVLEWLNLHPEIKKSLLIIVLSHLGDARQIQRAYNLGAHSFLPKPFTQQDSENLIRHFQGYWTRAT